MTMHRTGSPLLDEIVARRAAYLERIFPRPVRCLPFHKKPAEPEPEPEPDPEPEPEIVPTFPFLPREHAAFDSLPGPIAIRLIQKVTAQHFGITFEDMISPRRAEKIVRARMVAVYLCHKLTRRSTPDIGRRFGGRDHTSIIYAIRRLEFLVEGKPMLGNRTFNAKAGDAGLIEDIDMIKWLLLE